ncbi:MAG: [protein-PII] uridylyltransferase [Nitrospirae bacterium]|nr:[protein-PII] uridylyltransferase [Nitrospirota bacterium]
MTSSLSLKEILDRSSDRQTRIQILKNYLQRRRRDLYDLHKKGASGRHIVRELTTLTDEILTGLYRKAVIQYEISSPGYIQEGICLVAVGGYGRRELNPFSDMDIMFLYQPECKEAVEEISKEMLYLLWDLEFTIGHSVRTIEDSIHIGFHDLTARTALMESRLLAGSETLFQEFQRLYYQKVVERDKKRYVNELLQQIKKERQKFGSTVYILEPNIKRSEGGLRDIHYLQWAAFTCYGTYSLVELHKQGLLTAYEYNALTEAQNFLWIVRNEMHFNAGKSSDILTFREQKRLSEFFKFQDQPHLLGVEQFMQQYYKHSTAIHQIFSQFIRRAIPRSFVRKIWDKLLARKISPCFIATPREVSVDEKKRKLFLSSGEYVLKLFLISQARGLPISEGALDLLRRSVEFRDAAFFASPESKKIFMEFLSRPGCIAPLLRKMRQTRVLDTFISDFGHVNRLMQYNQYHKYTVDEHLIKCIEEAEALSEETGVLAQIYREIKRKDLLHLALLMHDIGKGRGGDHTQWGIEISKRVNQSLGLPREEGDLIIFLVQNHLLMSHLAFRRDLGDEKVLLQFARLVGQPEMLKMLCLLTYADIKGVGPDAWTDWKRSLLIELYQKTIEALTGAKTEASEKAREENIFKFLEKELQKNYSPEEIREIFNSLPRRILFAMEPSKLLTYLLRASALKSDPVLADVCRNKEKGLAELTVYTLDAITPGIFSKISGCLAANGLEIAGAQVHTTLKGIVVDSFQVYDVDSEDIHFEERWAKVKKNIQEVLKGEQTVEALFQNQMRSGWGVKEHLQTIPPLVEIDNDTSDECTIIDIFASDRQGLLYVMTKAIFDLGLSVYSAKIATRLDQIVDVFYVKDQNEGKVTQPERLREIKEKLLDVIDAYCPPS